MQSCESIFGTVDHSVLSFMIGVPWMEIHLCFHMFTKFLIPVECLVSSNASRLLFFFFFQNMVYLFLKRTQFPINKRFTKETTIEKNHIPPKRLLLSLTRT